jgi:hypothetical protein
LDPRSWPREWLAYAALVAASLLVLQTALGALARWRRRRRILARVARAGKGEARAASWLADAGYAIVGAQAVAEYTIAVDGEPVTAQVRADYLVEKGGARFVAEVKTGQVAPRIETTATRRQLLEYRVAFDVDGVLLVDAEAGRIRAITFPRLEPVEARQRPSGWPLVLVAVAVMVAVAVSR